MMIGLCLTKYDIWSIHVLKYSQYWEEEEGSLS